MKRILMVAMMAWVGCGGSSSPKAKCEDIGDSFCDRAVECIAGAQDMHEECFSAYKAQGVCANAKDVGPSYDSCMAQIDSASCAALFGTDGNGEPTVTLPNACVAVIRTGTSPADERAALSAAVRQMATR